MKEEIQYGFVWNNLKVERSISGKFGSILTLSTDKQTMEIRATMGGKLMINNHWKKARAKASPNTRRAKAVKKYS
jgi:hypothetical protein